MANLIPEDKIREVRNSADIVEIVSEAVQLKQAGKDLVGLCPFHTEKTPSFTVSPDKQFFYCFGCAEGGSVINFIMKYDGLSFPEAIKKLAGRYGVDLPLGSMTQKQRQQMTERDNLLAVNSQAAEFYHRCLLDSPAGKGALAYLTRRGLTRETLVRYKLGYAPQGWDSLLHFFTRKKVPARLVEKTGLIVPRKGSSGHHDRLRDRVVFPIFNLHQSIVGFGGRVMDNTLPKYINSPETPLYSKRRSLYGIERARGASRSAGVVHIVEGYFDLLALHQNGFVNAVATLGTSLTDEHLRMLRGLMGENGKAVLVYDSDAAGINAAKRSVGVFDRGHVDAHILVLPEGHDPDSYLLAAGSEAFARAVEKAQGIIPFLLDASIADHGLSISGKMRVLAEMTGPLAAVSDITERSLYVKEVAERLEIDEPSLLEKIRHLSGRTDRPAVALKGHTNRMEQQVVRMMFQFPELLPSVEALGVLDVFEDAALKSIADGILASRGAADQTPTDIISRLQDAEHRKTAVSLAFGDHSWNPDRCMRAIRLFAETRHRRKNNRLIDQKIKAAEQLDDQDLLSRLLTEKQRMAVADGKKKPAPRRCP